MDRAQRLQEYKEGYARLQAALTNLPPVMWHYKPAEAKWSVQEILMHLADSEVHAYLRCRTILAEPGALLLSYDEHQWSVALNYAGQDAHEALALIALIRRLTGALLDQLPAALWRQHGLHSKSGPMTLDDWLETYTEHLAVHIAQLATCHRLWQAAQTTEP
jgi:hypothetical protein